MSAPADSTMSGGNAVASDGSRLQQPTDAVAMDKLPQSPSNEDATWSSADADTTGTPVQPAADASKSSLKGKEKVAGDDQPAPAASDAPDDNPDSGLTGIGPSQDTIKAATPGSADTGPVCNITLLLTTGGRHPYKLDARYLSRRNVVMPDENEAGQPDPFSISIYTLKELILREWRADWEGKPANPGNIRLIHFGKLLDDKEPLKTYQFVADSPNVVHMSIRPPDLDEEEPKPGNKAGSGGDGGRSRSGGCCVIL